MSNFDYLISDVEQKRYEYDEAKLDHGKDLAVDQVLGMIGSSGFFNMPGFGLDILEQVDIDHRLKLTEANINALKESIEINYRLRYIDEDWDSMRDLWMEQKYRQAEFIQTRTEVEAYSRRSYESFQSDTEVTHLGWKSLSQNLLNTNRLDAIQEDQRVTESIADKQVADARATILFEKEAKFDIMDNEDTVFSEERTSAKTRITDLFSTRETELDELHVAQIALIREDKRENESLIRLEHLRRKDLFDDQLTNQENLEVKQRNARNEMADTAFERDSDLIVAEQQVEVDHIIVMANKQVTNMIEVAGYRNSQTVDQNVYSDTKTYHTTIKG